MENTTFEKDLAEGSFIENWPSWLRWLLFLPSAVIAPILFSVIQSIFSRWYLGLGEKAFYFNMMRGFIFGAGFVYIGASVAPKKQKIVALILLVLISMICAIAFLQQSRQFVLNEFLEDIITLGASIYACYYINKEENLR